MTKLQWTNVTLTVGFCLVEQVSITKNSLKSVAENELSFRNIRKNVKIRVEETDPIEQGLKLFGILSLTFNWGS